MAVISTLLSETSITSILSKVLLAFLAYWVIDVLSQYIAPRNPKAPPAVPSWVPFLGNAVDFGKDPIQFLQSCQKKYGDVFTFRLLNKRVTACLSPDGNQFVFNAKQNMASAAAAYNHMTKYVFGNDVVFDTAHSIFMEQKRIIKGGLNIESWPRQVTEFEPSLEW
ncbi:Putative Lanosterol 14-alpha demethylase [Rhizopus microsporus]|nr:Putative Lanosterol 14-alpha demethylase [Rhizopus microsporus]